MGKKGRDEDDLIAWTWKHFMLYPNQPDWLLRLPMTKAVRLAFDTIDDKIQALKNTPAGRDWKDQFGDVIDEFTVAGYNQLIATECKRNCYFRSIKTWLDNMDDSSSRQKSQGNYTNGFRLFKYEEKFCRLVEKYGWMEFCPFSILQRRIDCIFRCA